MRILIIFLALAGLAFFFFSTKWYLAQTISSQANSKDLAELSVSLAPDDPQTHFASAVLHEKTFLPEDLEKSLAEYQKTTSLTPNNYLAWLDLGRAYETSGNQEFAEKSLRRAEQLAPHYSDVKWVLGNFLLRRGNSGEGFEKIKIAAETSEKYVKPFVSIVWQSFESDIEKTKQIIGDSTTLKSAFAVFLASQKNFDEAMNLWNSIPSDKKIPALKDDGDAIYKFLIADKRVLQALEIKAQLNETNDLEIGKINNGGFEKDIQSNNDNLFDWSIGTGFHPVIGFDDQQKKQGIRSLVYIFNSDDGKDFRTISQTVAVKSGVKYQLQFYYRSNLKTSSTLKCNIINGADGNVIGSSNSFKTVTDWSSEQINFITPENTQGIIINLSREQCKSAICPISGKVWLDEFSLTEN